MSGWGLIEIDFWAPPRDIYSIWAGEGPSICISNKVPGEGNCGRSVDHVLAAKERGCSFNWYLFDFASLPRDVQVLGIKQWREKRNAS